MAGGSVAVPVAVGGGAFVASTIVHALDDLGKDTIEAVTKVLTVPITVEFGGYGKRWGGRWSGRKGQGTATYIRRLEVPLVAILGAGWVTGIWKPGGLIGAFMARLFGAGPSPLAEALHREGEQALNVAFGLKDYLHRAGIDLPPGTYLGEVMQ